MSYSIIDLFINASLVVQLVIFLLLLASIFSWMVIFERWIFLNKSKEELVKFEDSFWSDAGLEAVFDQGEDCLLYTSPSPRDRQKSRMPSSA